MALPVFNYLFEDSFVLSMKNLSPSDISIMVSPACFSQLVNVFGDVCHIEGGCLSMDCRIFDRAEQIRLLTETLNCYRDGSLAVGLVGAERLLVSVVDD